MTIEIIFVEITIKLFAAPQRILRENGYQNRLIRLAQDECYSYENAL